MAKITTLELPRCPRRQPAELVLIVFGNFSCNDCMAAGGGGRPTIETRWQKCGKMSHFRRVACVNHSFSPTLPIRTFTEQKKRRALKISKAILETFVSGKYRTGWWRVGFAVQLKVFHRTRSSVEVDEEIRMFLSPKTAV